MSHSIADIVLKKTGHEDNIVGFTWLCLRNNSVVSSNGKTPFSMPEEDHQEVITAFYFASWAGTRTKLYERLGDKYGRNSGRAGMSIVSSYVKNLAKQTES